MKSLKAVKLLLLLIVVAIVATGCRGCLKGNSTFGKLFGRTTDPLGAQDGINSCALPEPIRGQTPQECGELKRVYFGFDSVNLLEPAKAQLDANAQWLKSQPAVHVQIEGHCDERGTAEYNYALGQRRADTVRNYLINQGVESERLHTISYGMDRPDDSSHNETTWAKNRRAQFLIYAN